MSEPILCRICGKRRARRACPAVHGDICTICCGTEREVSLSCPLECEYLREAHRREKAVPIPADQISNQDIEVSEEFMQSHETLLMFCVYALALAGVNTPGAIDSDVMVALEALIQTHRTRDSGLIYETRPENSVAAAVQRGFNETFDEYERMRTEREGLTSLRNSDVLKVLVFLHRIGQQIQNGRPRSRAFLDMIKNWVPPVNVEERAGSIIL